MASTAISDPEDIKEIYDSEEELLRKVDLLAEMVRNSKHFVAFTGAGISTSAGIPDFRGPEGKWTRQAKGLDPKVGVSIVDAYPTDTHMAMLELYDRGILQYVISQNCDGLHRRSGLPAHAISELHGNCWMEVCEDCGQQYFRDYKCMRITKPGGAKCPADHFTGRFCDCSGRLLNSTIDFGQSLPVKPLELAEWHSEKADLHLACGSSLRVTPACDQPANTANLGGKLVIVNLQKTPLTDLAAFQIYAKTDDVMRLLMKRLEIPIPEFRLLRRIVFSTFEKEGYACTKAVDPHNPVLEVDHIKSIKWCDKAKDLRKVPLSVFQNEQAKATIFFQGHYHEPAFDVEVDLSSSGLVDIVLAYDPVQRVWEVRSQTNSDEPLKPAPAANEARIPDYGASHLEYCVDAYMRNRECTRKDAVEAIKKRFESAKENVRANCK